jgi:hypothetical protein
VLATIGRVAMLLGQAPTLHFPIAKPHSSCRASQARTVRANPRQPLNRPCTLLSASTTSPDSIRPRESTTTRTMRVTCRLAES